MDIEAIEFKIVTADEEISSEIKAAIDAYCSAVTKAAKCGIGVEISIIDYEPIGMNMKVPLIALNKVYRQIR